jgi:plastocyanin
MLAAIGTAAAMLAAGPSAADRSGQDPGTRSPAIERGVERIVGSVGPGFTISVRPRRVDPGRYRLVIRDRSSMHNWHIRGRGVNKRTGVAFQGTRRFTVELTEGRYRIRCDPHPTSMRTRLRVAS